MNSLTINFPVLLTQILYRVTAILNDTTVLVDVSVTFLLIGAHQTAGIERHARFHVGRFRFVVQRNAACRLTVDRLNRIDCSLFSRVEFVNLLVYYHRPCPPTMVGWTWSWAL